MLIFKVKIGISDMNVVVEFWLVLIFVYGFGDLVFDYMFEECFDLVEYDWVVVVLIFVLIWLVGG